MRKLFVLLIALLPVSASAEVLDKEPSLSAVLLFTLVASSVAFLAARARPWLLALALPVIGLPIFGHLCELTDPYVGLAIYSEAGDFYRIASWATPAFVVSACVLGLALRRIDAQRRT